ncbi:hypothetical protein J6590_041479 [Homalodisca vitripennis]|nr:hypothetical protein J6590_041479 [Homalodisca vitripennis]
MSQIRFIVSDLSVKLFLIVGQSAVLPLRRVLTYLIIVVSVRHSAYGVRSLLRAGSSRLAQVQRVSPVLIPADVCPTCWEHECCTLLGEWGEEQESASMLVRLPVNYDYGSLTPKFQSTMALKGYGPRQP